MSYTYYPDRSAFDAFATIEKTPEISNDSKFSINSFRAELKKGIIRSHSYLVVLAPFNIQSNVSSLLSKSLTSDADSLVMRCDTAVLPAIRFNTDDNVRRYGYGPVERVPHSVQFNEFTLSWIVDPSAKIVGFFNNWMNTIVNFHSAGGNTMMSPRRNGKISFSPYEVGYKDDYANPLMSIFVYNEQSDKVIEYKLYDVFPTGVNEVSLAHGEVDTALKLTVSFAFTDLEIVTPKDVKDTSIVDILRVPGPAVNYDQTVPNAVALNTTRLPATITKVNDTSNA